VQNLSAIDDAVDEMIRLVYSLQGTDGNINQSVTKFFADHLWKAVTKGYGNDLSTADFDTPDYNMLQSLRANVWQFASAKNYQQLRELSDALLDVNGQLRSFEEFSHAAKLINGKFMKTWLRSEYNLAVAGGQMAGKWVDIDRNSSTLPYLVFEAVIDNQTTELCAGLHGTMLPVGHAFWNRFYPPNHFGCRSTVRQVASGVVTPEHKIPSVEIPSMFQTNLGKKGLIFPEDHPYFTGIPLDVKNQYKG
jgi:SPP1 gp7 family putative phage head morphogenesis protein